MIMYITYKGYMILSKILFFIILLHHILFATEGIEYAGISITVFNAKGKSKNIIVKRDIPDICKQLPINNTLLWTNNFAHNKVPDICKSTYVHTTGHLLPMHIHTDIETYGELEVLAFMKAMQTHSNMLLIDARKQVWFDYRTIPGAINIPFHHIRERVAFEFEFEHALTVLGVAIKKDESLDFTHAKTLAIFCNGPWCSQSIKMIEGLLAIGYPATKIRWYRGGMQDWLSAGMTSTRK